MFCLVGVSGGGKETDVCVVGDSEVRGGGRRLCLWGGTVLTGGLVFLVAFVVFKDKL